MKVTGSCNTQDPPAVNYHAWLKEESKTPTINGSHRKRERG
ncbi:hypothetical protein GYH30_033414 [Glycine max]|nr:hypothetical protein GYH30_033414 [Glycine max]